MVGYALQQSLIVEQLMNLSDEELVGECKKNECATTILLSRYAKLICKIANNRSAPGDDIDDLIQEGLIGLFSASNSFNIDRGIKFSTYANVCISNRMTTALIKNNNKKMIFTSDIDNTEKDNVFSLNTPESILIEKEKMQELYEKITIILSEKEMQIFRLFITGSTYDQMARQLNIPLKVVDNAMQRVRRKLKSVWRAENFSN